VGWGAANKNKKDAKLLKTIKSNTKTRNSTYKNL
jgi:hypothetical protein